MMQNMIGLWPVYTVWCKKWMVSDMCVTPILKCQNDWPLTGVKSDPNFDYVKHDWSLTFVTPIFMKWKVNGVKHVWIVNPILMIKNYWHLTYVNSHPNFDYAKMISLWYVWMITPIFMMQKVNGLYQV